MITNAPRLLHAFVPSLTLLALMVALLGCFGLDAGLRLVSAQRPEGTDDVQIFRVEIQPVNENGVDTSLTVFRGTLMVSVKPQVWILEFDNGAPEGFVLTNAKRWPTLGSDIPVGLRSDYATEMGYYHVANSSEVYESCCTFTPAYDRYFIPILQEYYVIYMAGKPVVLKASTVQYGTTNLTTWFNSWDQLENGNCLLRCLAPVDMVFSTDSSQSLDPDPVGSNVYGVPDGDDWKLQRNFISEFKRRYFFTTDQDTARLAYLQFSGFRSSFSSRAPNPIIPSTFNDIGTLTDRICTIKTPDPTSLNPSDWGIVDKNTLDTVIRDGSQWPANFDCVDGLDWNDTLIRDTYGWDLCGAGGNSGKVDGYCGQGFALVEGLLSGNSPYIDFVLDRTINSGRYTSFPGCFDCIQNTAIGTSITTAGDILSESFRGKPRVIITITDGLPNVGISTEDAVEIVTEQLNADPGPKVRLLSIGVGDFSANSSQQQLLAAAGYEPRNVLRAANYSELEPLLPRLISLSCDENWDLCQSTCSGFCSPCGDCLCPACPDLECKLSIGCENGICLYSEPEADCCEAKLFEACERRGGTLDVAKGCECTFPSDDADIAAVLAGSLGGLLGVVVFLLLALLLLCLLAILVVTVIILILKGRAIAAAIAALGSNAFGAGDAAANPTYEGMHTDGANPLYDADEEDGL